MKKRILSLIIATLMLMSVLSVTVFSADTTITAIPTASVVMVNNTEVSFDAYNINGNNYFKLRDLAYKLNGTKKQFGVGWDGKLNAIYLKSGESYIEVGGEMASKGSIKKVATPTTAQVYLDGRKLNLTTYNIAGNNYFKMRDIGQALDFRVEWDGENNRIFIDTGNCYRYYPMLPDCDFGGYNFTFLTHGEEWDWATPNPREIFAEYEDGSIINDAVYRRNMMIEATYNINIKMVSVADERFQLKKAVNAGDDTYDAVVMFNNNVPGIVTSGLLLNTSNLTHVDLSKPWWDPAVNSLSIANKNYVLAGDLLILDKEATQALIFNKNLNMELGFDSPYVLVKEGKWTMDVMDEYIKCASRDLNGDGIMKPNDDRWGLVCYNETLHSLLVSGGGTLASKDADDLPYMDFASSRNLDVIWKAMNIIYNKNAVLNIQADIADSANRLKTYSATFEDNRALFMWVRMRNVGQFRGMDSEFGILPLPKFDESQENYYSPVNPYIGALLGVPMTAAPERTSIILEAMAAESRYTLQPAYYETLLRQKYMRDEESEEMLDIIFGSKVYDIGAVYSFANIFGDFCGLCYKSDRYIASFYEKRSPKMDKAINKVVDIIMELD